MNYFIRHPVYEGRFLGSAYGGELTWTSEVTGALSFDSASKAMCFAGNYGVRDAVLVRENKVITYTVV